MSALSRDYSATFSGNWIINRRMDLTWFIGAALSGYALFFMHAWLGWDMVRVWFLWVVLLDSPHLFGTFRRHPDEERNVRAGGHHLPAVLAMVPVWVE